MQPTVTPAAWIFGSALVIMTAATPGLAGPVPLDISSPGNGFTDLYSTTFDGSLVPCSGSSPSYCPFFGGEPPNANRGIIITPRPTGLVKAVPLGFAVPPASGSYLDLTLAGNLLTIAGGTIAVPSLLLQIRDGTPQATDVIANGVGVVFDVVPQVATVDANGRAEFLVSRSPATAVDFSNFTTVAFPPVGSCAGPLCTLVSILTLDMIRYRLVIDYDPTFAHFTAEFIGQTANNSMLAITMTSSASEIAVSDSVDPADDQQIPFGDVNEGQTSTQTVTVTNSGIADLVLGAVNGLAAPFTLANDLCSGQTLTPMTECTFEVRFQPTVAGVYGDTLDIPYNDSAVTVTVTGTATGQADDVPDPFAFTDQPDVPLDALVTSDPITVAGINVPTAISVAGGEYSIGGAAFTAAAGTVSNGATVRVRHTSAPFPDHAEATVLDIGGVTDTFTSTTVRYAIDDAATTTTGTPVDIDVLQNDLGFPEPVYAGVWIDPAHGDVTVTGSPGPQSGIRFTYTPHPGYTGDDYFEYWAEGGSIADYALVSVSVISDDSDGDGVVNAVDNCLLVANPGQRDTNGDGYGNICDPDLNNSGLVTAADYAILRSLIGTTHADADLNGNGVVTALDYTILRSYLNLPPGPSALRP